MTTDIAEMTDQHTAAPNGTDSDTAAEAPPLQIGTFETVEGAESALFRLFRAGIHREQISTAAPRGTRLDFPGVAELRDPGEPATEGAVVGGVLGAAAGGVASTATVAAISLSGLVLAGPLFAGIVAGGVAGGLVGAMAGRGTAKDLADRYEQAVRNGRILIAVEPRVPEEISAIRAAFHEARDGETH